MPPVHRIMPSIKSAKALQVSNFKVVLNVEGLNFTLSGVSLSLSVQWTCPRDLKVPLPSKIPLFLAFPGSTTVPMARSPYPLPSASCPRTPPSRPSLELLPTCSTVTQVAWAVVQKGTSFPLSGNGSLVGCKLTITPGVNLPSTGVCYWCLHGCDCLNAYLSQRNAFQHWQFFNKSF